MNLHTLPHPSLQPQPQQNNTAALLALLLQGTSKLTPIERDMVRTNRLFDMNPSNRNTHDIPIQQVLDDYCFLLLLL